jgi:predicted AlkP superfamily pyrophosphatase or phosphodiesterase
MPISNRLFRQLSCFFGLSVFILACIVLMLTINQVDNKVGDGVGRKVILISMDGFRHDYIEKAHAMNISLPAIEAMISAGVRGMHVMNAFPTITLPNHQTLVTGLYPESNDIVLNNFIDPKYPDKVFEMNDQDGMNEEFWYTDMPEPIWVTLQRQKNRLSGSMLWPITDAPFSKDLPFQQVSQFTMLDGIPARYPYKKRVDDVIWWLTNSRYTLDLILMYFDEPDETGHAYGPNSKEVIMKVKELDKYLGYLFQRLNEEKISNQVDIILTADHGMSEISSARLIEMDRYVDPSLYTYTLLTPIGTIYPYKESDLEVLYDKLKNAHPNMKVYMKGSVPSHLHYNDNRRIAPLILVADNGWSIIHNRSKYILRNLQSSGESIGGNHGYDPSIYTDVHPFLVAKGGSFRVNFTTPLLHMVDVYPLMCHLLNILPQPNNGTLARIAHILSPESEKLIEQRKYWGKHGSYFPFFCQKTGLCANGLISVLLTITILLIICPLILLALKRHKRVQYEGKGEMLLQNP